MRITTHSSIPPYRPPYRRPYPRYTIALVAALLQALAFAVRADTSAIYRWTDETGIVHYSQWPPERPEVSVEKRRIELSNALDYDPRDDPYSVQNQAERIGKTWDSILEEKGAEATARRLARAEERLAELERETNRLAAARPVYTSPFLFARPHPRVRPLAPGGVHERPRPPDVRDHRPSPEPGWPRPGFTGHGL